MTSPYRTAPRPQGARINLSRFVHQQANTTAKDLGFGWVGVRTCTELGLNTGLLREIRRVS